MAPLSIRAGRPRLKVHKMLRAAIDEAANAAAPDDMAACLQSEKLPNGGRIPDPSTPILTIDNYPAMLRIIRSLLTSLRFTDTDQASDGASALAMLQRRRYELIICNWDMKEMSGQDFLCAMRRAPVLCAAPVIMIGTDPRAEAINAALDAGASTFLAKPFSAQILKATIERAFRTGAA